jgi:hypothetical protein
MIVVAHFSRLIRQGDAGVRVSINQSLFRSRTERPEGDPTMFLNLRPERLVSGLAFVIITAGMVNAAQSTLPGDAVDRERVAFEKARASGIWNRIACQQSAPCGRDLTFRIANIELRMAPERRSEPVF